MIPYRKSAEIGELTPWPFDNPESDYRILQGNPKASGRMDFGGVGQVTRLGIWHCTVGVFECNELGDELQTIISGRVKITVDGTVYHYGAGDSFYTKGGNRVTWEIIEDVTKIFYAHKADRF